MTGIQDARLLFMAGRVFSAAPSVHLVTPSVVEGSGREGRTRLVRRRMSRLRFAPLGIAREKDVQPDMAREQGIPVGMTEEEDVPLDRTDSGRPATLFRRTRIQGRSRVVPFCHLNFGFVSDFDICISCFS